jgi:hypothetical protein
MKPFYQFLVRAFFLYRVSRMIATEDGPFRVFHKFRRAVVENVDEKRMWLAEGVECPLCISFWLSLLLSGNPVEAIALSGAASWLYKLERQLQ